MEPPFTSPPPSGGGGRQVISDSHPDTDPIITRPHAGAPIAPVNPDFGHGGLDSPPASGTGSSDENPPARTPAAPRQAVSDFNVHTLPPVTPS